MSTLALTRQQSMKLMIAARRNWNRRKRSQLVTYSSAKCVPNALQWS